MHILLFGRVDPLNRRNAIEKKNTHIYEINIVVMIFIETNLVNTVIKHFQLNRREKKCNKILINSRTSIIKDQWLLESVLRPQSVGSHRSKNFVG